MALAEDAQHAEDLDLEERVDDAVDVVLGRVPGEHEVLERGDQRRRVPPQLGWEGGEEEGVSGGWEGGGRGVGGGGGGGVRRREGGAARAWGREPNAPARPSGARSRRSRASASGR